MSSDYSEMILNYVKVAAILVAGFWTYYQWDKTIFQKEEMKLREIESAYIPDLSLDISNVLVEIAEERTLTNFQKCLNESQPSYSYNPVDPDSPFYPEITVPTRPQFGGKNDNSNNKNTDFCNTKDSPKYLISFNLELENERLTRYSYVLSDVVIETGEIDSEYKILFHSVEIKSVTLLNSFGMNDDQIFIEASTKATIPILAIVSIDWCCGESQRRTKMLKIHSKLSIKNESGDEKLKEVISLQDVSMSGALGSTRRVAVDRPIYFEKPVYARTRNGRPSGKI